MNPETINTITQWLGLIIMALGIVGGVGLFTVAIYQSLKSRVVRWDALLFAGFLLWVLPYGIRNYGPVLTDATIDLLHSQASRRGPMEDAIKAFIGGTGEGLPVEPTAPIVINTEQPTIVIVSTPWPTVEGITAVTATPMPPAIPTATPEPTRYVCQVAEDFAKGCYPPTPIPGG